MSQIHKIIIHSLKFVTFDYNEEDTQCGQNQLMKNFPLIMESILI
jgi:hypothetical protein